MKAFQLVGFQKSGAPRGSCSRARPGSGSPQDRRRRRLPFRPPPDGGARGRQSRPDSPSPSATRTRAGWKGWGQGRRATRSETRCWSTARGAAGVPELPGGGGELLRERRGGKGRRAGPRRRHGALPGRPLDALPRSARRPWTRVTPPRSRTPALTSYHAVKRSLHLLGPGSTAVVIGVGGLGQMAV